MTEAEYLAYDLAHEGRHEFVNGEVYAMAGGSAEHALATMNLGALLHGALRGGPCRVYSGDLRVRVDETGLYTYPDLTVICGRAELAPTTPPCALNPRVVVEVLSASTEAYDRGAKASHYRRRPSIEAIVFVSTTEPRVEVHTRNLDGSWTLREATDGEIAVPPIGVSVPVAEIYAGFDALAAAAESVDTMEATPRA
jgi:Uma2 family endonuclease